MNNNKGFTLVELMVVVAVIGILSSIAIPQFQSFQARSRAGEAKIQLSGIYSAMTAFEAEYGGYATCLRFMGYKPAGMKRLGNSGNEASADYNGNLERFFTTGFRTGASRATWIPNSTLSTSQCPNSGNVMGQNYFPGRKLVANNIGFGALPTAMTQSTFIVGAAGVVNRENNNGCNATANDGAREMACYTMDQTKKIVTISKGY